MMAWYSIFVSLLLLMTTVLAEDRGPVPTGPPKAKTEPVVDVLHGHKIVDPYRWLEDTNNPATQQFVNEQLAYTRSLLDPLPGRDKIHSRLEQLLSIGNITAIQPGGPFYFYTRSEGTQNQAVLYVREGVDGVDRALVDPNQLAADGTIALDWWTPTHDGKYVAYGLSPSGSEMSTLHIIEAATGKQLSDIIERTRAASIAWKLDNSGFYYTRYPKKGEVPDGQEVYNRHVFYHALGTDPAKDPLVFGEGRDPEDWPNVSLSNDDRWLLIEIEQGWTKSELYLMDLQSGSPAVRITDGKNFLYTGTVYDGKIFVLTNEDAPRYRVFVTDASAPARTQWSEIIPQQEAVLQSIDVVGGELLGAYQKNVSSQLWLLDLGGKLLHDIPLPGIGTVSGTGGTWDRNELFFGFQSFTMPPAVYRVDMKPINWEGDYHGARREVADLREPLLWAKVQAPSVDPSAYSVNQVWYRAQDGTSVPMFLVHKRTLKKDGKNPTLLIGYGGFNINLAPAFTRSAYLWMEHGGIYAVANLRGGAEFGEDWHRAGMLDKKQNVFDDFIAAAEYLVREKYTDADHLAIQGGSNSGLLMGAALTQRPNLFRAVVCQVPLLDMLRYQNFQIAKLWIPEYGSADDPKQFDW